MSALHLKMQHKKLWGIEAAKEYYGGNVIQFQFHISTVQ